VREVEEELVHCVSADGQGVGTRGDKMGDVRHRIACAEWAGNLMANSQDP
jgi:hypothetical protein